MARTGRDSGRQRPTSVLTRVLGAACFAGATTLTFAFVAPGLHNQPAPQQHKLNKEIAHSRVSCREKPRGNSSLRASSSGRVAPISSAVAQSSPPLPLQETSIARTRSKGSAVMLELPKTPPLTLEEEEALMHKVHQARLLRRLRKRLASAAAGDDSSGTVPPSVWAREAGMDVEELRQRLQAGLEAKETLIERNMPMVFKMVQHQYKWRLHGGQVSTADLVQEGAYALGLAAERFDPEMGTRFLTYAVFVVREKLDTALAVGNMSISIPVAALKEFYVARGELAAELGRSPSEAELANFFANGEHDATPSVPTNTVLPTTGLRIAATIPGRGLAEIEIEAGMGAGIEESALLTSNAVAAKKRRRRLDLLAAVQRVTSLDSMVKDADGGFVSLADAVEGTSGAEGDPLKRVENDGLLALLPKVLTPRQAQLVRMACGLADGRPRTMQECAQALCLSVARTKALFEASLHKLRIASTVDTAVKRLV